MDFIWEVLALLIERLESTLNELRRAGPDGAAEVQAYDVATQEKLEDIEASAKEATDRAKQIISRSAIKLAKAEMIRITELILCDMAATYVANANKVGDDGLINLMGRIEPYVLMIGYANTPLLTSYLKSLQFPLMLKISKHFYSAWSCPRRPAAAALQLDAQVA